MVVSVPDPHGNLPARARSCSEDSGSFLRTRKTRACKDFLDKVPLFLRALDVNKQSAREREEKRKEGEGKGESVVEGEEKKGKRGRREEGRDGEREGEREEGKKRERKGENK